MNPNRVLSSRGRDRTSNLLIQSQAFCQLNYPRSVTTDATAWNLPVRTIGRGAARLHNLMGSLVKKRRKRMRKKKHRKMLKRTRFQRRAKGK